MSNLQKTDPNCLFCKISDGRIPSQRLYEDDFCTAFLDINPVNHGHVLIVPRYHHKDITELPSEIAAQVAKLLPGLAKAVVKATGADGFNVIINNGAVAGQTIFHGHWHIIPDSTTIQSIGHGLTVFIAVMKSIKSPSPSNESSD